MGKNQVQAAVRALERIESGTEVGTSASGVQGYSGAKLIAALGRLTEIFCGVGAAYLELGVFRGLTLLSNAYANPGVPCYGIDNFSLFDEDGKNLSIVRGHIKRLKIKNATVIDRDFDDALDSLAKYIGKRKIGVFLVDGPHDYRSQIVPLLKIVSFLADECVIVVDDANYPHVRQATNDFLKTHPDFALLMEAYTPKHIANMNAKEKEAAIAGWWDGVNVMVRDPGKTIPRAFAKEDQRQIYPVAHEVFRHEFAEIAPELLKLAGRLADGRPNEGAETVKAMKRLIQGHRRKHPGRFHHQNTYSEKLPAFRLYAGKQSARN